MAGDIKLKGLAELGNFLEQLPVQLEAKVLRGALRAGAKLVQPAAKMNLTFRVHRRTGRLSQSDIKLSTRVSRGRVTARLKVKGPDAWRAKFVEFATAAHGKHPGTSPQPFLRPALDSRAGSVVVAAAGYMKKKLSKQFLKNAMPDLHLEAEE